MSVSQDSLDETPEVRNHWWWRPGWRIGRHFYACHLTFEREAALHALVKAYQGVLAPFPNLDLIPTRWLHLTMQGIGFVDQVSVEELQRVREAISQVLGEMSPPTVTFFQSVVRPEAIYLPAEPDTTLQGMHRLIGQAIDSALGDEGRHQLPEQVAGYRPHISLAYANAAGSAAAIRENLSQVQVTPVEVTIREVPLLTFNRDERMYVWTTREPISIG